MYAFGPLPKYKKSGRIIGTHQKIDRIARRHLMLMTDRDQFFPSPRSLLHFEGSRGPDGVKLKSPGKDEPWHFIDPKHIDRDGPLLSTIEAHMHNLAAALGKHDEERAAFEASWLAHAVTDGLTPAHHDPLDEQVKGLRHDDERQHKFRSRIIMKSDGSSKKFIENNWKYWGAKGVMTTHTLFEGGVATTIKPLQFNDIIVHHEQNMPTSTKDFIEWYIATIKQIDELNMYETFKQTGWTRALARQTTKQLLPMIIEAVVVAWYIAIQQSKEQA
jgi:hypothetical protein